MDLGCFVCDQRAGAPQSTISAAHVILHNAASSPRALQILTAHSQQAAHTVSTGDQPFLVSIRVGRTIYCTLVKCCLRVNDFGASHHWTASLSASSHDRFVLLISSQQVWQHLAYRAWSLFVARPEAGSVVSRAASRGLSRILPLEQEQQQHPARLRGKAAVASRPGALAYHHHVVVVMRLLPTPPFSARFSRTRHTGRAYGSDWLVTLSYVSTNQRAGECLRSAGPPWSFQSSLS